jgi:type VI secretion system secreted protein Hcp
MAYQGYMSIKGDVQGTIEFEMDSDLHDGTVPIFEFKHDISVGKNIGEKRMIALPRHDPVSIVKEVDSSTPYLYRSFLMYENLEVVLEWYEMIDGVEDLSYSITLKGARITGIESRNHDVRDSSKDVFNMSENIQFAYQVIEWEYHNTENNSSFEFDLSTSHFARGARSNVAMDMPNAAPGKVRTTNDEYSGVDSNRRVYDSVDSDASYEGEKSPESIEQDNRNSTSEKRPTSSDDMAERQMPDREASYEGEKSPESIEQDNRNSTSEKRPTTSDDMAERQMPDRDEPQRALNENSINTRSPRTSGGKGNRNSISEKRPTTSDD